ncbi:MAG TPA: hypothetical protein VG963_30375 [Polyangiaceae bacterium]|nr:hypothetical protein [Polyangiaceae bacterium]
MSNTPPSGFENDGDLSAEARELLARVRSSRRGESVPESLRARALSRVLSEVQRPAAAAVPANVLVPVRRASARALGRLGAAIALAVGALCGGPRVLQQVGARLGIAADRSAARDFRASGPAGELLSPQSPLFRMPLLPIEDQAASTGPGLLGKTPFSEREPNWQARRWSDPKALPDAPVAHEFEQGALCVLIGPGERVLTGWPWPQDGTAPAPSATGVALSRGHAYRLSFEAWVRGPIPSQVLLGVGHTRFPFMAAAGARVQVSRDVERFAMDFVASDDDASVGIAFLAANGPHAEATHFCIGDLSLTSR